MKKEFQALFDQLQPPPALAARVAEIPDTAGAPVPHRRWLAVAACLVLLLAGGAFAAAQSGWRVHFLSPAETQLQIRQTPAAGVTLYGDRPALSTDALSPALLERIDQAGEEGLLLAFDSWEAAADFSGLSLPQPPLLAALPMDPVCCGVGEGEAVGPVALHCAFLDGVPSGLSLHAQYRLETDVVGLSFYSHLDGSPTDADGALLTLFQPNVRFSQRDYTTAGGHSAVLITAQPEGEGETTCHGFLLLDAQLVEVQCDVPGVVEQLLDQF